MGSAGGNENALEVLEPWREHYAEPKVNHYPTQITSLLHAIKDEIKT